ncbi:MAG TPA: sigma-70 family RNA polymerase sigma factor [Candidatus Dormibacteraeota bacterium]|jgi:RNA polymerase sigma factor (sigma-70 family)|nr:sigma-70 family RNA polymerase sigma factor [Candidatus Dormibacteraeota bacterium]
MDEKAKDRGISGELVDGELPLRGCEDLLRQLHEQAQAARWGLNLTQFSAVLDRAVRKRMSGASLTVTQREEFLCTLHLEDLALAHACAMGQESAWESFVQIYRPYLRSAAAAILRTGATSAEACELADSLFAELYGLAAGKTGERSLFRYFHGRSSLKTWLRAVLAQRRIDAVRAAKRFESLDEPDGDGKVHEPAQSVVTPLADPHRSRYVQLFQVALASALNRIETRDRQRLRLYYVEEKTLAEIGKKLGEHESSVSRNLERIRREMRENVEEILGKPAPGPALSAEQIELCFQYAAEEVPIDLGKLLKQSEAEPLQKGKQDA